MHAQQVPIPKTAAEVTGPAPGEDLNWKSIFGGGLLGGIGFTMSIFVTLLAFDNETIINNSKLIILISSLIAGLLGFFVLNRI